MAITIIYPDIPRSVLARLLDLAGKSDGISPRPLLGEPAILNTDQLSELYAGGYIDLPEKGAVQLSRAFNQVAQMLLNPHTNVTLRIWGKDSVCGETNIQFPRDMIQGKGVILNQIGSMYRISAFVEDSDVTKLFSQSFPIGKEQDIDFAFEGQFDGSVAAVLFGVLDLARNHVKSGMRPGESIIDYGFSVQQLYDYLSKNWGWTGFKDLLTYIVPAGIMPEPPSLLQTVDGLRSLVKVGLLHEDKKDRFSIFPGLEPLVNLTVKLQSGIQWQRVARMDSGELVASNRIYLFGDRAFILCLTPTVAGRVYIARAKKQEITDFILDEITAGLNNAPARATRTKPTAVPQPKVIASAAAMPKPPVAAPAPVSPSAQRAVPSSAPSPAPAVPLATPKYCNKCGASLKPDAKHCNQCGAPVISHAAPDSTVCPQCGQIQKPGAKFCNKCGATLVGQTPSSANVCPQCGRQLNPDAKFCPGCGRKL